MIMWIKQLTYWEFIIFIFPIFAQMIRDVSIILLLLRILSVLSLHRAQEPAKPKTLKQWNLSQDFTEEVIIPFDTVFSLFHRYRII